MSNEIISREELNKQLMKGAGGIAGGIGLLVLGSVSVVPALIMSGVVVVAGIALSRSKKDRLAGLIAIGAGALGILARIGIPFLSPLLFIGGIGLIGAGGIALYKFIKNMQKRS